MNARKFNVADLLRCNYNRVGPELIYIVKKVGYNGMISITPVYEFFGSAAANNLSRRSRQVHSDCCTFVDIVSLAKERQSFDAFINSRIESLTANSTE